MSDLIERLERGVGQDEALNDEIFGLLRGPRKTHCEACGCLSITFPDDYTGSLDAAMTIAPDENSRRVILHMVASRLMADALPTDRAARLFAVEALKYRLVPQGRAA